MPVAKRTRATSAVTAARRAASRSLQEGLEAILRVVELNTQRISRLEDVFAIHAQQREEAAKALKELELLLRRGSARRPPRRKAPRR